LGREVIERRRPATLTAGGVLTTVGPAMFTRYDSDLRVLRLKYWQEKKAKYKYKVEGDNCKGRKYSKKKKRKKKRRKDKKKKKEKKASKQEKLDLAFKCYDIDNDDLISTNDLFLLLKVSELYGNREGNVAVTLDGTFQYKQELSCHI